MTTTEHIQHWLDTAAHDWEAAEALQAAHPRTTSVFAHWTLEKLSKALWVREHSSAIPPASDDVAELLAAAFVTLTPTQAELVGRVKAFHDDVVEYDPERLAPQLKEHETPLSLLAEVDILRQQLLATLSKEAVYLTASLPHAPKIPLPTPRRRVGRPPRLRPGASPGR